MAKFLKRHPKSPSSLILAIITIAVIAVYLALGDNFDTDYDGQFEIHAIDVGQGDSTLIRQGDSCILIDAGTNSSEAALEAYLDYLHVDTIDCFIATHPHEDHIGGADMILEKYQVNKLLLTDLESTSYTFEALLDGIESSGVDAEIPAVGDEYTVGDMKFTVLAPLTATDDANNMSIVIKLTYGNLSFMFMGDAEMDSEFEILSTYSSDMLDCDFLKVGHHGSKTSSSSEFLNAVSPEIALISCGRENSYGHPHGVVLDRLKSAGVDTILRTDRLGTLVITSDGKEIFS